MIIVKLFFTVLRKSNSIELQFKSFAPKKLISRPNNLFKRPNNTFYPPCFICLGAQIILPLKKSHLEC